MAKRRNQQLNFTVWKEWIDLASTDNLAEAKAWISSHQEADVCINSEKLFEGAAIAGAVGLVEFFIDAGVEVDARLGGPDHPTALMHAATKRHLPLVRRLLELGANPNASDRGGSVLSAALAYSTALEQDASFLERTEKIVRILLLAGAIALVPESIDAIGVAATLKTSTILDLLLASGAPSTSANPQLSASMRQLLGIPLRFAIEANRPASVRALLDLGADPTFPMLADRNTNSKRKTSPLLVAIEKNRKEFVAQLLEAGADVNATPEMRHTTLMCACAKDISAEIVSMLLARGARPGDAVEGWTALALAYVFDRRDLIDILVLHDKRPRGRLGIMMPEAAAVAGILQRSGLQSGVPIINVFHDTGADRAGILPGDVLVGLAGKPIASLQDVSQLTPSFLALDTVEIEVWRQGARVKLTLELAPFFPSISKYGTDPR